jgi:hypothetical protein
MWTSRLRSGNFVWLPAGGAGDCHNPLPMAATHYTLHPSSAHLRVDLCTDLPDLAPSWAGGMLHARTRGGWVATTRGLPASGTTRLVSGGHGMGIGS